MKVSFETKGDSKALEQWLKNVSSATPSASLNSIARQGEQSLAANTPKDTGVTASGWKAKVTSKGTTSEIAWTNTAHSGESVNIAVIIDQGHGTGTGGYVPPKPYIKKSMNSVWSTAGDKIAKELIK